MSRERDCRGGFLFALAGLVALAIGIGCADGGVERSGDPSAQVPAFTVPAWVDRQINETLMRFERWSGADDTVVFPVITDIHAARPLFSQPPDFRDTKFHVLFAQRAAVAFKADFFAELGDIGFDRDPRWKPSRREDAQLRLESQRNLYKNFSLPVLFCMGNHDSGRAYGEFFSELRLSAKEYGVMFNGMTKRKGVPLVTGPNEDYGYYDVPGKKCRAFFLNTSDAGEVGFSTEQMHFLAAGLNVPTGTCVVMLVHKCIHPTIGKWKGSRPGTIKNGNLCMAMLADFVTGSKGAAGPVQWDFAKNSGTTLAGCVFGDSHFNDQAVTNGINFVITQGYGTISAKDLPERGDYVTPVDRTQTMLVDVVALKPARREMMVFRIGADSPQSDRAFRF
ncbi:MAG TPA: hypothetical protein PLU30_10620 [Verrucomicrobiae bacterium]|nr:hypothetical protein [Verrucomicrobiae bacterium]